MQVLAFPAVGTTATSKEEASVFHAGGVGACEAGVALDVAARLRLDFAGERRLVGGERDCWN